MYIIQYLKIMIYLKIMVCSLILIFFFLGENRKYILRKLLDKEMYSDIFSKQCLIMK